MIQSIPGLYNLSVKHAPLPQASPSPTGGPAFAVAGSTSRDVSAALNITTREGDTFSLSASFDTTSSYAGVRSPGVRARAWNFSTSSQVSLQVSGDLSKQEAKDISRIVRTFLHDLRAMLRGRDVSIANVATGDAKTLESVSATAETSTTVTAVAINGLPGPGFPGGPPPQHSNGEDSYWRHHGTLAGVPRGVALPQPAPEPFTPEVTAPLA